MKNKKNLTRRKNKYDTKKKKSTRKSKHIKKIQKGGVDNLSAAATPPQPPAADAAAQAALALARYKKKVGWDPRRRPPTVAAAANYLGNNLEVARIFRNIEIKDYSITGEYEIDKPYNKLDFKNIYIVDPAGAPLINNNLGKARNASKSIYDKVVLKKFNDPLGNRKENLKKKEAVFNEVGEYKLIHVIGPKKKSRLPMSSNYNKAEDFNDFKDKLKTSYKNVFKTFIEEAKRKIEVAEEKKEKVAEAKAKEAETKAEEAKVEAEKAKAAAEQAKAKAEAKEAEQEEAKAKAAEAEEKAAKAAEAEVKAEAAEAEVKAAKAAEAKVKAAEAADKEKKLNEKILHLPPISTGHFKYPDKDIYEYTINAIYSALEELKTEKKLKKDYFLGHRILVDLELTKIHLCIYERKELENYKEKKRKKYEDISNFIDMLFKLRDGLITSINNDTLKEKTSKRLERYILETNLSDIEDREYREKIIISLLKMSKIKKAFEKANNVYNNYQEFSKYIIELINTDHEHEAFEKTKKNKKVIEYKNNGQYTFLELYNKYMDIKENTVIIDLNSRDNGRNANYLKHIQPHPENEFLYYFGDAPYIFGLILDKLEKKIQTNYETYGKDKENNNVNIDALHFYHDNSNGKVKINLNNYDQRGLKIAKKENKYPNILKIRRKTFKENLKNVRIERMPNNSEIKEQLIIDNNIYILLVMIDQPGGVHYKCYLNIGLNKDNEFQYALCDDEKKIKEKKINDISKNDINLLIYGKIPSPNSTGGGSRSFHRKIKDDSNKELKNIEQRGVTGKRLQEIKEKDKKEEIIELIQESNIGRKSTTIHPIENGKNVCFFNTAVQAFIHITYFLIKTKQLDSSGNKIIIPLNFYENPNSHEDPKSYKNPNFQSLYERKNKLGFLYKDEKYDFKFENIENIMETDYLKIIGNIEIEDDGICKYNESSIGKIKKISKNQRTVPKLFQTMFK